jgi:SAM-dependent methyltransferase
MTQEETIEFHKPANQNDIQLVQSFIYPVFSRKSEIDRHYWSEIRSLFLSAMKNANLNFFKRHIFWFYVNRTITSGLKKGMPLIEVEQTLRRFIRKRVDPEKDRKALAFKRSKRSFELVKDYIIGESILDLGAGEGLLALEIKKQLNKEVRLVDVVDYNFTDLPLILYNPDEKIPLSDKTADTTILFTVLHHASDPEHLLREATRLTRSRLVIVEGYVEEDDKRITNIFFDWFYNRVIGDEDINVPLNFLKVKGWEKILNSHGFKIVKTAYLGINEPIVPEHQILIIADHS